MDFRIPEPLKKEHEELHSELVGGLKAAGSVGAAARHVAELLHPHFVKEEEYALPPLALLTALAVGPATSDMKAVLPMTDRLKADLPEMLAEHQAIITALESLAEAANREGRPEYARFAAKLILHARTEEEVLYPAAILVGELVRLRLGE